MFLGNAEMLLNHSTLFAPLDLKRRLFTKVTHTYPRGRIMLTPPSKRSEELAQSGDDGTLVEALFAVSSIAQIALNNRGAITMLNEQARKLLNLGKNNLGRTMVAGWPARPTASAR